MISSISSGNSLWGVSETAALICFGAGAFCIVREVFYKVLGDICREAFVEIDEAMVWKGQVGAPNTYAAGSVALDLDQLYWKAQNRG